MIMWNDYCIWNTTSPTIPVLVTLNCIWFFCTVVFWVVLLMLSLCKLAPFGLVMMNSVSSWLCLLEIPEKCKPWKPFFTHLRHLKDLSLSFAKSVFGLSWFNLKTLILSLITWSCITHSVDNPEKRWACYSGVPNKGDDWFRDHHADIRWGC